MSMDRNNSLEAHPDQQDLDKMLDEALADSFPASDPPSIHDVRRSVNSTSISFGRFEPGIPNSTWEVWSRRIIMWLGRASRHAISNLIVRFSRVGNTPVFANDLFPWTELLTRSWHTILLEAEQALVNRGRVPSVVDISPDHKGIADKAWKSFFLWGYGYRIHENCRECPRTEAVLRNIPGLETAFFSILEPAAHLTPHRGVSKAILTCHLGLRIPHEADACWMKINGTPFHWHAGGVLIFDDTFEHEVLNNTADERMVLLIHVRRPLRFPGSVLAALFLDAVRRSPFIQDALRNLAEWNGQSSTHDKSTPYLQAPRK